LFKSDGGLGLYRFTLGTCGERIKKHVASDHSESMFCSTRLSETISLSRHRAVYLNKMRASTSWAHGACVASILSEVLHGHILTRPRVYFLQL